MSRRTITMTDELYEYMLRVSLREPEVLKRLRHETAKLTFAGMQISPEQGQFMRLVNEILGSRRTLEVGVFTGYSAISVALALPQNGRIIACDVNEEWTRIAQRYFAEAGVADKIDLRIRPAVETLDALIAEGHSGQFDFAFVDADKEGYLAYYERCLTLLRTGGIVAFDNVLWDGRVADPADQSASTVAVRALNDQLASDERVTLSLVPIGDGLTLARKRH